MQKRRVLSVLLIVFMTVCVLPFMSKDALAETKTFREISIDYGSAALADGEGNYVLLTYTSNSTLTLGEPVRARVLVVGGGGSGSSGKRSGTTEEVKGFGGRGGLVVDKEMILPAGEYEIAVGKGGEGVKGTTSSAAEGKDGTPSYIGIPAGDKILNANGGSGGKLESVSGVGTSSDITGSKVTYGAWGKDSAAASNAPAANTGSAGDGLNNAAETSDAADGVVIIKIYGHEHDFSYSASGDTFTASCSKDGCELPESKIKLTMTNEGAFDDASLSAWTAAGCIAPKLSYYGKADGTQINVTDSTCMAKGEYTVKAAIGEAVISKDFTIGDGHFHIVDGVMTEFKGIAALQGASGSYYLTQDVSRATSWVVTPGTTNLCLNGHVIRYTRTSAASVITVGKNVTLNIFDCGEDSVHYFTNKDIKGTSKGYWKLETKSPAPDGSIALKGGCITGGFIDNSKTKSGGITITGGTVNLYGGNIVGNYVYSNSSSQAGCGGGIYVADNGVLNMFGGRICGNSAGSKNINCNGVGGGIYIGADGFANIYGGEIRNNIVSNYGGGVYSAGGLLTVGGTAYIRDNESDFADYHEDSENNVMTGSGNTYGAGCGLAVASGKYAPQESMNIGIRKANTINPVCLNVFDPFFVECFSSDNASLYVIYDLDNSRLMVSRKTVHAHGIGDNFDIWPYKNKLPNKPGKYALLNEVTIGETWVVPEGKIELCLNGNAIYYTGAEGSVIRVGKNSDFELYDCAASSIGYIYNVDENGLWTYIHDQTDKTWDRIIMSGVITGGKGTRIELGEGESALCGGAVFVSDGGVFAMYGGTLCANTADLGGGVYNCDGTFILDGGKLQGNWAGMGGGVYNTAAFDDADGFAMYSGTISENTAKNDAQTGLGGGVYNEGDCTIVGGTVSINIAEANGSGVAHFGGSLTLGGSAKIVSNSFEGDVPQNDLCIGVSVNDENPVLISEEEDYEPSEMSIGVTTVVLPDEDSPVAITLNGVEDDAEFFFPNNTKYFVNFNEDHLELLAHEHNFSFEARGNVIAATCTEDCPSEYDELPLTLTLTEPMDLVYNGTPKEVRFADFEAELWQQVMEEPAPEITYEAREGSELTDNKPVNAGQYTARISIEDGAYIASLDFTIAPAELEIAAIEAVPYTGEQITPKVVLNGFVNDEVLLLDTDYTVEYGTNVDAGSGAGSAAVTLSDTVLAKNYAFNRNSNIVHFDIDKIDFPDEKTASGRIDSTEGSTAEIPLPKLPEGAELGTPIESETSYLKEMLAEDGMFTATAAENISNEQTTLSVVIPVSSTNYNDYEITITINVAHHMHGDWKYSAEGGVLTATCGREGCSETPYAVSLTLDAPISSVYDGNPKEAGYSDGVGEWLDAELEPPIIEYYLEDGEIKTDSTNSGAVGSGAAPVFAGRYVAKAEADGAAATAELEISNAAQVITADDLQSYIYGETGKSVVASALDDAILSFAIKDGSATDVVDVSADNGSLAIKKAGTTVVTVSAAATRNYNEASKDITIKVDKAKYDGTKTGIAELCKVKGSTVTTPLPKLPDGAQLSKTATGFAYGTAEVTDGNLVLTVGESPIPDGTDLFVVEIAVTGATNYEDYTIEITVTPVEHKHEFTYSAYKNVLTATCTEGCSGEYDELPLTLTLSAPSFVYDGMPHGVSAAIDEQISWNGAGCEEAVIVYYLEGGTEKTFAGTEDEGKAPTAAGKYVAKATVDTDKTAELEYTIAKKDITVKITPNGGVYKGTITPAQASFEGLVSGESLTPVLTYTAEGYDSTQTPQEPGSYTVTASLPAGAENYNLTGTKTNTFDISKAIVLAPKISGKVYTGETLTADVAGTELYTVAENDGGIRAGYYDVVLQLTDPDHYKWEDTQEASLTLSFEITKASNEWTKTPLVQGITYGETLAPVGEAKFGSAIITYTGINGTSYSGTEAPTKAGSYKASFAISDIGDYEPLSKDVEFTIAKLQLTAVGTTLAESKIYDSKTAIAVTSAGTLTNLVSGDDVVLTAEASFADKKVGMGKPVTVVYTISGADAENYIKPENNTSLTSGITAKQLLVSGTSVAASKLYDALFFCGVEQKGSFTNLCEGDSVTLLAEAWFDDKRAEENKPVTVVYNISGEDAENYIKPEDNTSLVSSISPVQLTVSGTAVAPSKVYDGKTAAEITDKGTLSGIISDDKVELSAEASYDDENVGESKAITVVYTISGEDAENYIKPVDNTALTADITKAEVAAPAADRTFFVYNGSPLIYRLAENELYKVSGNVNVNVGSYDVEVSLVDKNNYKWTDADSEDLHYSFIIAKAANAIRGLTVKDSMEGAPGELPSASADFGIVRFVYAKAGTNDFSMAEYPKEVGKYIVRAYVDGNENYAGASSEMPFAVNREAMVSEALGEDNKPVIALNIRGGFDPNLILEVKIVAMTDELVEQGHRAIIDYSQLAQPYEKLAAAYTVRLFLNGVEIQPKDLGEGTVVTARALLPKHIAGGGFRLLHVHAADDVSEIVPGSEAGLGTYVITKDGYLETQLDRLSEFVFFYQPHCVLHWYMIAALALFAILFIVLRIAKRRVLIYVLCGVFAAITGVCSYFAGCIICTVFTVVNLVAAVLGVIFAGRKKDSDEDEEKDADCEA